MRPGDYSIPDSPCQRGIILAGGTGSRLFPTTLSVNKHLLPVYDKPMIYYPLSTLMLAGIREILIISNERGVAEFRRVCGDGSNWGIRISYAVQHAPNGIAEALLIGAEFIADEPTALILGDNIFYGHGLSETLTRVARHTTSGAAVLTYRVADPSRYGVLYTDASGKAVDIIEKPQNPKSNRAVTGLYFLPAEAVDIARTLSPSQRNELEITDLNREFLRQGRLHYEELGRGSVWFDAGTSDALFQVSAYIEIIQRRQGTGVAFPEEVAVRMGYLDAKAFQATLAAMPVCAYRAYLETIVHEMAES